MKIIHTVLKVLLSLILISPVFGILGIFPEPTPDMYGTPEAFAFIQILMESKYIMYIQSAVFIIAVISLWTQRMALASLLLLPISVNIVGFHAFLDGGLFTAGAIMGNFLFLVNIYFLYLSRQQILPLLKKN